MPCDIAIFAAAVADWRVANVADEKIKKSGGDVPTLAMAENPDILKTIATLKDKRPRLVVGFAAETEKVIEHAKAKLAKKGCDLIVANDVSPETGVFGGDSNSVHIVTAKQRRDLARHVEAATWRRSSWRGSPTSSSEHPNDGRAHSPPCPWR